MRDGLVSVAVPCHNAAPFVQAALDSLIGQSYGELEILAVDDGSTDDTASILESYSSRDRRIRVIRHESNRGLIASLNRAVTEASGEFLARMDADDVAAPHRLERQVAFLRGRPNVGVVGCAVRLVAPGWNRRPRARPVRCHEPDGARFMSLLGTPVAHTSVVARTDIMKRHPYGVSSESLHTEDYELFSRMIESGVAFANLDDVLLTVALDPDGVSLKHEQLQVENFVRCARRHLQRTTGWDPDEGAHRVLVNRMTRDTSPAHLRDGLELLDRAEDLYSRSNPQAAEEIRRVADMQRVDILIQAALRGSPSVRAHAFSRSLASLSRLSSPTARQYMVTKIPTRRGTGSGRSERSAQWLE